VVLSFLALSGCHGLWQRPCGVHCQAFDRSSTVNGGERAILAAN
jgi:hypothetical protein